MIYLARAQEIEEWFIVFHPECDDAFWRRVVPGRFKHVRAFAWAEGVHAWVFFDVWLTGGARLTVSPGGTEGFALIAKYVAGASVLKMRRGSAGRPPLSALIGFWCVPAVRRLLNLPGSALRPDALWRDCLANGAEIVIHGRYSPGATGPDAGRTAAAGPAACDAADPAEPRPTDREFVVDVRKWDAA